MIKWLKWTGPGGTLFPPPVKAFEFLSRGSYGAKTIRMVYPTTLAANLSMAQSD
jgi:hypothetical protein